MRERLGAWWRQVVLAGFVGGLAVGPFALLAAAGVALLRRPGLALGVVVAVVAGTAVGDARVAALDRTALGEELGQAVSERAILLERPRARAFQVGAAVRIRGERVVLQGRPALWPRGLEIGMEVAVQGRLEALAGWQDFERRRGAHAALEATAIGATGRRRGGPAGFVDGVRSRAERALTLGMPAQQAALARGMVLGQDDALDERTLEAFRVSGLAHLLAASGQNVALLALLAIGLLGLAGAPLRLRYAVALALVALYVPLAGAGPSIQRAGVMGGAALIAGLAGRPSSRAHALLLAAAATLVLDPRAVTDPGWQLSFAAVVAIALLTRRWADALRARGVPSAIADAAALTAAATIGTAPLLAAHFEQVSLVSLPANLLVAPAVAPIVWLGTLAGAVGQVEALDPVVRLLDAVAALPLGFVALVAETAARVPSASVGLALGGPLAVAAAYGAIGLVVASRRARAVGLGAGLAALLAAGWMRAHPPAPPKDVTVSFLDVGQGDATLLQQGPTAILVDTGPPDGPILDRLRAAGVRRLDLLVLTHAQADHEGAATRVLDALPVEAVLDGGDGVRTPERAAIGRAIAAEGARRLVPDAGDTLTAGPFTLRVLSPRAEPAERHAGADPNERAIVLDARAPGLDVLLTADAESPVLAALPLPRVDVLKIPHHGSADPGLPALLARTRPRLAAIPVGAGNGYGHPAPATVAALEAVVPHIVRTDRDGTVRVTATPRGLVVRGT